MHGRKQCWSDGAAQDNALHDDSHSFPKASNCHVRAHSLNDLHCLPSSAPLFQGSRQFSNTSSSDLATAVFSPRYPLFPCRSPEARSPTPPGLPSFGTPEAETLRLMPLTHFERLTRFLQERFAQRGTTKRPDQQPQGLSRHEEQIGASANRLSSDEPAEMLRRALGTTRPVAVPIASVRPERSGLPKGVIRSAHPGFLARADDRTHIRGRFGVRASGHGVGNRPIDFHPFARIDGSHEIDAAVREIDKACSQHETLSNNDPDFARRRENTSPRAASTTAMVIAESLTAIQAIEREQRALRALRQSRRENVQLKAALKALQESTQLVERKATGASAPVKQAIHITHTTDPSWSGCGTVPPLRGDSEQTIEENVLLATALHPEMVEPALYSSYSSNSHSPDASDISPPQLPAPVRRNLPTMESMIENQTQAERRQATDEALNQYQMSKASKCDHC